jgi:hypothetical protein
MGLAFQPLHPAHRHEVRSYYRNDVVWNVNKTFVQTTLGSSSGGVYLYRNNRGRASSTVAIQGGGFATEVVPQKFGWKYMSHKPAMVDSMFKWESIGTSTMIRVPNWLLVVPLAIAVAIPWLRWRFSLRTLLIATTLVAVVLGLIVYAARQ